VETLYEIDIEYQEEAEEHGITMHRAPSLNLSPMFTDAMADIVATHLRGQAPYTLPTTRQYPLRCPGCVNEHCGASKEYFATHCPQANSAIAEPSAQ
jgi:ferrochelatase